MSVIRTMLAGLAVVAVATSAAAQPPSAPAASVASDLDAFMAKVLEKRNENWRTLHDYILSERETFEMLGPLGIPLHSLRREFTWFIRDGYLVRSPLKANGVGVSAAERAKYEENWLRDEKAREERLKKKQQQDADDRREVKLSVSVTGDMELTGLDSQGPEPRFFSEAYFMRFRFEPGNYYFAGRETFDGREVLKIEYLPSSMFDHDRTKPETGAGAKAGPEARTPAQERRRAKDADDEARLARAMNKTSTVTMWIDPQAYQIVRFTFDNADWGFLPGRQVARVDDTRAAMTMGLVFDGIWLPRDITFTGAATFAPGTLRFTYRREFYDYRRGEVSAKIRAYVPKEPQS